MVINSSKFNFAEVVKKYYIDPYNLLVTEAISVSAKKVGREAAKRLQKTAPRRKKDGGRYAKGWAFKMNERSRWTDGGVVYGKSGTYQLAHLLEHGHAKRGGGRTKEIVHIKPVEEWAINEFEEQVIDYLVEHTSI